MRGKHAHPTIRAYPQPAVPIFEQRANSITRQPVAGCVALKLRVQTPAIESVSSCKSQRSFPIYQQFVHRVFIGLADIHPVEFRARWREPPQPEETFRRAAPDGAVLVL